MGRDSFAGFRAYHFGGLRARLADAGCQAVRIRVTNTSLRMLQRSALAEQTPKPPNYFQQRKQAEQTAQDSAGLLQLRSSAGR